MSMFSDNLGLYTDFYELTMAHGYYKTDRSGEHAVFDYFFRTNPFQNGFTVFAGLGDFLEALAVFRFQAEDLAYLGSLGMSNDFLQWLSDFRFQGTIHSVKEGEVIFPQEPAMRVEGNLVEAQLIESLLLNIINFQSLVATKACRIRQVAGSRFFSEFGLRRAQGWGAMMASRAACIGGASATSNVLAAKKYGIPVSGTMAHSWVQSFAGEYEAFSQYARINGNQTILLVDTFNTLRSGVPNAIRVAKEMEKRGERLKGIRLDSGDLAYLSTKAREMLDQEGLQYVSIVVSNQLNEHVIKSLLVDQHAPIDAFGVGTELAAAIPDAALDGVYKLAAINGSPRMKYSDNIGKTTLPGIKKVARFFDTNGKFFRDGIFLDTETPEQNQIVYHPVFPEKNSKVGHLRYEYLLHKVFENGQTLISPQKPMEIHEYLKERLACLPVEHCRFISPHLYKVGISEGLLKLRAAVTQQNNPH